MQYNPYTVEIGATIGACALLLGTLLGISSEQYMQDGHTKLNYRQKTPCSITYPDAFMSREELVKTIGHEKVHHRQLELYGPTNDSVTGGKYEKEAEASEERWWQDYQNGVIEYDQWLGKPSKESL